MNWNVKEILASLTERMRGPLYVPTVSTLSLVIGKRSFDRTLRGH
jgi:hypothetical protein